MTALFSLTNSASNRSNITQLYIKPQSDWSHFSREHSSMGTESLRISSCKYSIGGGKRRKALLKICPPFYILAAWKSESLHSSESSPENCHQLRIWTYTCPQWRCIPSSAISKTVGGEGCGVPLIIGSTSAAHNLSLTDTYSSPFR